jgi:APA family basic amino acid/polyamine antiporter
MDEPSRKFGTWSGVGLVISNMIGAGVFLSAGFMAQDMNAGQILLAWAVGAIIALAGAWSYAAVAELVPRSGGEYRYLSELLHPALGYLAGWGSLLLGFSAPIAVDALSAGAFAGTLVPGLNERTVAVVLVVVLTALHSLNISSSRRTQNLLVALNAVLLVGFVALGLGAGRNQWPSWVPPNPSLGFPLKPFMASLFFIAFAFSGWNAAVYASEDFEEPTKDVPRAMIIGCALVAVLYLLVNWVFVANLTPERAQVVFTYETTRVTLGHLITRDLAGALGGEFMSILAIVAFVSAMSAMTFAGPRLYAAMAKDGFLPRVFEGREGQVPVGSVILQGALTLVVIFTHSLPNVLQNVGAILTLYAALTALCLFRVRWGKTDLPMPSLGSLCAAGLYIASAAWMLYYGLQGNTHLPLWVTIVVVVPLVMYLLTHALHGFRKSSRTASKG